ncbi:WD domain, G-beta repeat [Plasmodiophora brassicae]
MPDPDVSSLPAGLASTLPAHQGAVLALAYNSDGQYALSGGHDKTVRLWNPRKGTQIKQYQGTHGYEIRDIACAFDNAKFASCGGDRTVFVTDVASGRVLKRYSKHEQRVNVVAFNADASVLFSGSYDRTVCAWDLRSLSRDPIHVFKEARDSVSGIVARSSEIIVSSVDGCVRAYDLRGGRITTDHMGEAITSLAVSSDDNCLLLSILGGHGVRLIDRSNGELLNEYSDSQGKISVSCQVDARFSRDDAFVVSGGEDGVIRCWDLVSGDLVRRLKAHQGVAARLVVHPTATEMVSAGTDGTIRVWQ